MSERLMVDGYGTRMHTGGGQIREHVQRLVGVIGPVEEELCAKASALTLPL